MIAAIASLAALTGSLAALPLAPAFLEMFLGRDTGPVPVKNRTESVAEFANDFRALFEEGSAAARQASSRVTALELDQDAVLEEGMFFADYIYAREQLVTRGSSVLSAVLGEKDILLGENTKVLCWIHAQGTVTVGARSVMYGRLSAGNEVQLGPGCSFERVHAPAVTIVGGAPAIALDPASTEEASILERVLDRLRVRQDFILREREYLRSNVVAGGQIYLSQGSHVTGSLKSNRAMELEPHVRIDGSLVSASTLRIGGGCLVLGPVLAEGELTIESGTQVGTPQRPTTVRAPRIRIAPGVTIHGSLWAHEHGQVSG